MRRTWATLALAAAVATLNVVPLASAVAQQQVTLDRIDVFLKGADMVAATQMLTQKTGLQFVIEPSAEPFNSVTLNLKDVSPEDAIRYIVQAAGGYFRRDESGVFIISRKPFAPIVPEVVAKETPKPKITKSLKVAHVDVRHVFQQVLGLGPFDNINVFRSINEFASVGTTANTPRILQPNIGLMNQTNPQAANTYRPVASRQALPATSGESGNSIALPGEEASQGLVGGGAGGGGGQFGGGGGQFGGGGGQFGGGGGQQGGNFQMRGGEGLIGQSIDYISYDPTDNSIVVRGSEEDISKLQRDIALFDVAPQQVQIKVEFITTSSSTAKSLGFDWLFQRGAVFAGSRPGSFVRADDPVFVNYATGNITARMRTLLQQGYGKVVNAPILRTLNNQPAIIQNIVNTNIIISQVISAGNGQIITAPTLFPITISTQLGIAPRINLDGTITVFINTQIADFGQIRRSPDGTEVPDQLIQLIQVVARVKNNETIALGGLTRKQNTGQTTRWPVLGDLPIIGQFFRFTTNETNTSELLIFVTPTVIEDDDTAGN
jgi:general secretion pathway protein D